MCQTERWETAASAAEVPRGHVSEDEVRALVAAELRDRAEAVALHRARVQEGTAETAEAQAAVLREVLRAAPGT